MSKVIREICAAGAVIDVAIRMTLRASKGCRKEKRIRPMKLCRNIMIAYQLRH